MASRRIKFDTLNVERTIAQLCLLAIYFLYGLIKKCNENSKSDLFNPAWIALTVLEIQGEINILAVFQWYHWICQPKVRLKSFSGTVTTIHPLQ